MQSLALTTDRLRGYWRSKSDARYFFEDVLEGDEIVDILFPLTFLDGVEKIDILSCSSESSFVFSELAGKL